MLRTFSYDYENSTILIYSMMLSDFAATIPLIRSFSMGDNWPPEYPIFPGSPIRYHYLFARQPDVAGEMSARFEHFKSGRVEMLEPGEEALESTPEQIEELKALGYL
jgi:hypothetical protein